MAQLELVQLAPEPLEPRPDHHAIARLTPEGAKVLDVGCGDGALMSLLQEERRARVRGIEHSPGKALACVRRGLSVVQGDAERDLEAMPNGAFDVVVFSHTLASLSRPDDALRQAARISEYVIVSIANAGHWRARLRLMFQGRLTRLEGEARQALTLRDFAERARALRLSIERATPLSGGRPGAPFAKSLARANWLAEEAVFLLRS